MTTLPEFLNGHARVEFHDANDRVDINASNKRATAAEKDVQGNLQAGSGNSDYPSADTIILEGPNLEHADGITSLANPTDVKQHEDGLHRPVLDIDLPVVLLPSSTEGHFHLMIDKEIPWEDYLELLWALEKCGIIEEGYVLASEDQGYSSVRLPWVKK